MLKVDRITITFGGITAVNDVSFYLPEGEILGIIGPNGSGKTTLFNIITGIYRPISGKIFLTLEDGKVRDITGLKPHRIARLKVARTFQNIKLFGYLTVIDNILLGRNLYYSKNILSVLGFEAKDYKNNREKSEEIIDFLDLKAYRYSLAKDIPLGIRKKVELARALAQQPRLLLLDEPTSGLTYEEKSEFLYYIKEINEKLGITLIIIEHDVKVISSIAKKIIALNDGKKIAEGTPDEILKNPEVIKSYLGE